MEITFENIHETVLLTLDLQEKNLSYLPVLGKWYFDFLESSEEKLSLHVPDYDQESINLVYNYIRLLSLTYRLFQKSELTSFKDTCLFNVFDFNRKRNNFNDFEPVFDFETQKGEYLIWSRKIITSKNRFVPVFLKKQIENLNWINTYTAFRLFQIIENRGLIKYPILIDVEKDLCLSLTTGEDFRPEGFILFETANWDSKKMTVIDAIEYEEYLYSMDLSHQITMKYPYHKNIHTHFCNIGKKSLELIFNSRFYYQNIATDDIILLPEELYQKTLTSYDLSSKFMIFDTSHSLELYNLLSDFKSAWNGYEFNRFTTPFPKYWFMFINQSIPKNEWFEMFKGDYPELEEKAIIRQIKTIIDLLYDLDWSRKLVNELKKPVFLLPEIKGIGKKRLEKALHSFKNYLSTNNSDAIFIGNDNNIDVKINKTVLLLDGFNIINTANILQHHDNLKILIPDFLFFGYQPWINYHLLNYQYDSLLSPKRASLDDNFSLNSNIFLEEKKKIIENIKSEVIKYKKKYKQEESDIEKEEMSVYSQDIVFTNEEEFEPNFNVKEKINDKELVIVTTRNQEYKFKASSQVLLRMNSIISCSASQLKVSDAFIPVAEIRNTIDRDYVINKLSRIPESVISFQAELSKSANVYNILKNLGLEYTNEKYFNDKYVLKEETIAKDRFILPKRKNNWKIICEYLGINTSDMYQAWISYYGSKDINEIKNIYMYILNLCMEKDSLKEIENPKFLNMIAAYLETKKSVFEGDEETNPADLAKSIISSIVNEISFHEIKEIKTV